MPKVLVCRSADQTLSAAWRELRSRGIEVLEQSLPGIISSVKEGGKPDLLVCGRDDLPSLLPVVSCPVMVSAAVEPGEPTVWGPAIEALIGGSVAKGHDAALSQAQGQGSAEVTGADTQAAILDALPANIALIDNSGVVLAVNERWRRFAVENGLEHSDYGVGESYLALTETLDGEAAEVARGLRSVLRGERAAFDLEYACHTPEKKRWFHLMIAPVPLWDGLGAVIMHVDVSEARDAREEIVRTQALYRVGARAAKLGGWTVDYPELKMRWSDEVKAILELPPDYPPNSAEAEQMIADDQRQTIRKAFLGCALEGEPFDLELEVDTLTGRRLQIRIIGEPVRNDEGQIVRVEGALQDISELKRAEVATRAMIDQARDAIIVRDLSHTILSWSKGAERTFGWTEDEAVGKNLPELLAIAPETFEVANRALFQEGQWAGEVSKRDRAGEQLILDCRWNLVRNAGGEPESILSLDSDVTERKRMELQILRTQRMESIGTLAGGIAHDLNNVLSPILMAIDLLKLEALTPDGLEILETMEISAKRGAQMVKQVLSFARGGLAGERTAVRINEVVDDVVKICADTFPKSVEIRTTLEEQLWLVHGDPTQLHQVLLNLCVNARDAMPLGGRLAVRVGKRQVDEQYAKLSGTMSPGPYLCLEVEDTGSGIAPEKLEKIFDPFYTTKALGHGTGLGLSTSLAIVKGHGGVIKAYSETGKGTILRVYLPADDEVQFVPSKDKGLNLRRGRGELVLVVDDEEPVRQITSHTLRAFGYTVLTACDGADALAIYAQRMHDIDLVITDLMMPVLDGGALVRVLLRLNQKVRVIAVSGLERQPDGERGPVKAFLAKPYTAELLLRTIDEVLNPVGPV